MAFTSKQIGLEPNLHRGKFSLYAVVGHDLIGQRLSPNKCKGARIMADICNTMSKLIKEPKAGQDRTNHITKSRELLKANGRNPPGEGGSRLSA